MGQENGTWFLVTGGVGWLGQEIEMGEDRQGGVRKEGGRVHQRGGEKVLFRAVRKGGFL